MNFPTSTKYKCHAGDRPVWHIPFPFGSPNDIGVARIDESGLETRLCYGRDYTIEGSSIICVIPVGCSISIWLLASVEEAVAANSRKAIAPEYTGPVLESVQAETVSTPISAQIEEAQNAVCQLVDKAETRLQALLDDAAVQSDSQSQAAESLADLIKRTTIYLENLREQTRREADAAIRAAVQCSLYRNMPGVSAVKTEEEIGGASPGLFIINPHLTHAPTPFMGVWPAKCENDMQWDGVFFIGPDYPDTVIIPPIRQLPDTSMPEAVGNASSWVPCPHSHFPGTCESKK